MGRTIWDEALLNLRCGEAKGRIEEPTLEGTGICVIPFIVRTSGERGSELADCGRSLAGLARNRGVGPELKLDGPRLSG